jgi:hypothetical protein
MWINIVYDTNTGQGCSAWGPYQTLEDAQAGDGLPDHALQTGCWTPIKLVKPDDTDYDPAGTAVLFDGDISRASWTFYGPFTDREAAHEYADEVYGLGRGGVMVVLRHVPAKEPA